MYNEGGSTGTHRSDADRTKTTVNSGSGCGVRVPETEFRYQSRIASGGRAPRWQYQPALTTYPKLVFYTSTRTKPNQRNTHTSKVHSWSVLP